jgi:hypothetical protein
MAGAAVIRVAALREAADRNTGVTSGDLRCCLLGRATARPVNAATHSAWSAASFARRARSTFLAGLEDHDSVKL